MTADHRSGGGPKRVGLWAMTAADRSRGGPWERRRKAAVLREAYGGPKRWVLLYLLRYFGFRVGWSAWRLQRRN